MNDFSSFLKEAQRIGSMTLEERIQLDREDDKDYMHLWQALDPRIKQFLQKYKGSFPAVDIGSSRAVGTIQLALTFRPPIVRDGELLFHPSDISGDQQYSPVEDQTRKSLKFHIQNCQHSGNEVLVHDKNNQPLFRGDIVSLCGLKAHQFNGKRGAIQGPDPQAAGRFAIHLSQNDTKSFKKENIEYLGERSPADCTLRELKIKGKEQEFYEGLLERTREVDVLKHETWSNVEELSGKCALLTCIRLLTCLGYRDPRAWQDTLELGSKLLHAGGYILQYDEAGHAGFGDSPAMNSFVKDTSLSLELEESKSTGDGNMVLVVWRKK